MRKAIDRFFDGLIRTGMHVFIEFSAAIYMIIINIFVLFTVRGVSYASSLVRNIEDIFGGYIFILAFLGLVVGILHIYAVRKKLITFRNIALAAEIFAVFMNGSVFILSLPIQLSGIPIIAYGITLIITMYKINHVEEVHYILKTR